MATTIRIILPEVTGWTRRWEYNLMKIDRAARLYREGIRIHEWGPHQYAVFDTEEEAAIFKLTHM